MKKVIKNPDGTVEELDGTPEEIAQLERERSRGSEGHGPSPVKESPGGRRILTDEIQRLSERVAELERRQPLFIYVPYPYVTSTGTYTWPKDWTITCQGIASAGDTLAGISCNCKENCSYCAAEGSYSFTTSVIEGLS